MMGAIWFPDWFPKHIGLRVIRTFNLWETAVTKAEHIRCGSKQTCRKKILGQQSVNWQTLEESYVESLDFR